MSKVHQHVHQDCLDEAPRSLVYIHFLAAAGERGACHCVSGPWYAGVARASDKIADSVADFLPGSIPRGAAKAGILTVGGLVVLSLLQKVGHGCRAALERCSMNCTARPSLPA